MSVFVSMSRSLERSGARTSVNGTNDFATQWSANRPRGLIGSDTMATMEVVGTVRSLHRYPVKSMVGEAIEEVDIGELGVPGDRAWAARNLEIGEQQGARKLPKLLTLAASFSDGDTAGAPVIGFPDGSRLRADDPAASERVSEHLGKPVRLVPLEPKSNADHYKKASQKLDVAELREEMGVVRGEAGPDLSSVGFAKLMELGTYATPPGTYFDAFPLHVLTTSSLRYVAEQADNANIDARRYRPNILIDTDAPGLLEPTWEGAALEIGDCRIRVDARTIRCSNPGRAQAIAGIDADKSVVRAVAEHADRHLGLYATVERPGRVRVGDPVRLDPRPPRPFADRARGLQKALLRSAVGYLLRDRG